MSRFQHSTNAGKIRGSVLGGLAAGLALGLLGGGFFHSRMMERPADANPPVRVGEPDRETEAPHAAGGVEISALARANSGLTVATVAPRPMQSTLSATGVVAADQSRVAHIRPLARGLVEKVYFQLGDRVAAGRPLIEYDNIELGLAIGEFLSARAELARALTDLEVKRTILARSEEMLKVGATARTTHDIRQAEYRDAEAVVSSRRAMVSKIEEQLHRFGLSDEDLDRLTSGDGEHLHRTSSHNLLRAPFSGIVTSYDVAEGELVGPSDKLLTITDISSVWVLADVYEKDLAYVRVGRQVDVRVASYPDQVFRGRITYLGDVIESRTRTAKVRCVVPNPAFRLKLEMFATIEIPTGRLREVLAVPSSAIQNIEGRPAVFVELSLTRFEKREVELGVRVESWTEILSGLEAGENVAAEGGFYLKSALLRDSIGGEE